MPACERAAKPVECPLAPGTGRILGAHTESRRMMGQALRWLSLVLAAGVVFLWIGLGADRGWTKTSVSRKTIDEVTGIEGISYEKRFVPGLDFPGAGLGGSALVLSVSLLFGRNNKMNRGNEQ